MKEVGIAIAVIALLGCAVAGLVQKGRRLELQDQANQAVVDLAEKAKNEPKPGPAWQEQIEAMRLDINNLNEQLQAQRWDMDDLRIQCRTPEEEALAKKVANDDPWNVVEVSADYPKIRLPYGVKVIDHRPKEVQDAARAKGEMLYMWLEVPLDNGRERRMYFSEITWKEPKEK